MNNPSPLVPQGSMLEQKNKSRARARLAVFFVLSVHVIGLMALLMIGCRREEPTPTNENTIDTNIPMAPTFEEGTNLPVVETNPPPVSPTATNYYTSPPPLTPTTPPPGVTEPPAAKEYTIVRGDTFSSIAKHFGVSVKAIQEANPNVDPRRLQIGQKIQIPPPVPAAPTSAPTTAGETSTGGQRIYTVKSGDTLTKIAREFGTTVRALRSENALITDRIKVGQKLKIPAKPTAPPPTAPPVAPPTNGGQM